MLVVNFGRFVRRGIEVGIDNKEVLGVKRVILRPFLFDLLLTWTKGFFLLGAWKLVLLIIVSEG